MVLMGTLRNQGFCNFVRALVWREVARVVVGAEDAVHCASVRREGSDERAYHRQVLHSIKPTISLCKLSLIRQAAAPYLAASLSTLALDAHIAAHISLVL